MSEDAKQLPLPSAIIEIGKVRVPENAVRVQFSRSSGPGGQNVNKVNTRCEIWVKIGDITGLSIPAQIRLRNICGSRLTIEDEIHLDAHESRSQERNKELAIERLRELIVKSMIEPKKRHKTKPSYGAKQRRLASKKRRGEIKRGRSGNFD